MRLSFFKHLFLTIIIFYVSSYMIMSIRYWIIYSVDENFATIMQSFLVISLGASILFLPVLLILSTINFIINHWVKYISMFVVMEFYGYFFFIFDLVESVFKSMDRIINYFIISIPSTIFFLILLIFLTNFFKKI